MSIKSGFVCDCPDDGGCGAWTSELTEEWLTVGTHHWCPECAQHEIQLPLEFPDE